jgi:hypothetical protein
MAATLHKILQNMERRGKNDRAQVGTILDCTYCNEVEYKRHEKAISVHHKGENLRDKYCNGEGYKRHGMAISAHHKGRETEGRQETIVPGEKGICGRA